MDESFGAQYALQIALQTLRERCHQFQQRIAVLEEENLSLRSKVSLKTDSRESSLSEVDSLKGQISQLTEQNLQLTSNVVMVSAENQQLWSRLLSLTRVNENLGSKLHKISDTLSNVTLPNSNAKLVRSKTFTQDEAHVKLIPKNVADENNRISLELEDISLKLMCNIAKEKSELELQCSQMSELQDSEFVNTFAFAYPSELDNTVLEEFNRYLVGLKDVKRVIIDDREKLKRNLNDLNSLLDNFSTLKSAVSMVSTFAQTNSDSAEYSRTLANNDTSETEDCVKICPMCVKEFNSKVTFVEFQDHVESHFLSETFDIL